MLRDTNLSDFACEIFQSRKSISMLTFVRFIADFMINIWCGTAFNITSEFELNRP